MKKNILPNIITLVFLIQISCKSSNFQLLTDNTRYKNLSDNEKTNIINSDYLFKIDKSNLNYRYRILPYIESKDKYINKDDLQDSFKFIATYDSNLFDKLTYYNFDNSIIIDQYHNVLIDLRYQIKDIPSESIYPTAIIMLEQGKILKNSTSFIGVKLRIFIRLSIFDKFGNELAYCQKKLFNPIYSNEFLSKNIVQDNSPFLTNLNENLKTIDNFALSQKIKSCETELFK
ncbi:hypothetical protein [Leptospira kanakyensis]|uniref:Uncharacterized protein n=1 Tax=Leptospira kanakyensis TaxID=2484968 RepID=A0A6N4PRJ9_9LEPT|nr:hypothetical protein [Leptospira kanakyensis]TGK65303.1 hypothetical protein EHQ18_19825 [Leptospira kanakyensis]